MNGSGRIRRLYNEYDQMMLLHQQGGLVHLLAADGDPPERYVVAFQCRGVAEIDADDRPVIHDDHRVELILTADYPRVRPLMRWMTPIFHPNFRLGDVCIKEWYPQQPLTELCQVLGEMVQYKNYNTTSPLNMDAALWAMRHRADLPIDPRSLSAHMEGAAPAAVPVSVYNPSVVVVGTIPISPSGGINAPTSTTETQAGATGAARFCRKCHYEFTTPNARFCPNCGAERRMA